MQQPTSLLQPDNPIVVRGWSLWVPPPLTTEGKPVWINANDRTSRFAKAKQTKTWREQACSVASASGIPELSKAWVQAWFSFGNARRRDVHNLFPTVKACIDGFTDAGLWVDDRDGILIGPDLRRESGDRRGNLPGVSFMVFEVI